MRIALGLRLVYVLYWERLYFTTRKEIFMSLLTKSETLSPIGAEDFALNRKILAVLLGSAFLTISSYISVPFYPVPVTMQTFAVLLIGALYGWRMASATVASWLLAGAIGVPVFAGGGSFASLIGPTGGYLIGFLVASSVIGFFSNRGWNGDKPLLAFLAMLLGVILIFGFGFAWLSKFIGFEQAFVVGVVPFIFGDILKAVLAVSVLRLIAIKMKKST